LNFYEWWLKIKYLNRFVSHNDSSTLGVCLKGLDGFLDLSGIVLT